MHLATHRRVRQTMVTGPSSTCSFTTHLGVRFCFCFSFSPGSVRWQVASLHRLIFHPQILPRTLRIERGAVLGVPAAPTNAAGDVAPNIVAITLSIWTCGIAPDSICFSAGVGGDQSPD